MSQFRRTLVACAISVLFAGSAVGQVSTQEEITEYDQPQQCDGFFIRDGAAAPGTGRAERGEITPREEVTQYNQPQQLDCVIEEGRMVIPVPDATGTIVIRRPPTAAELEALYRK